MSKLTKEELTECQKLWGGTDCLAGKMVAEILSLRESGDEEVESQHGIVQYFLNNNYLEGDDVDDRVTARMSNDRLRDIAITRGQQLREAREEIERLNLIVCELKDNFGEMEVGA